MRTIGAYHRKDIKTRRILLYRESHRSPVGTNRFLFLQHLAGLVDQADRHFGARSLAQRHIHIITGRIGVEADLAHQGGGTNDLDIAISIPAIPVYHVQTIVINTGGGTFISKSIIDRHIAGSGGLHATYRSPCASVLAALDIEM